MFCCCTKVVGENGRDKVQDTGCGDCTLEFDCDISIPLYHDPDGVIIVTMAVV